MQRRRWIGLNTQTRASPNEMRVNPVVGVRWDAVHRLIADVTGRPFDRFAPPTVHRPLHTLVPGNTDPGFAFRTDASMAEPARELAEAVRAHGLPYVQSAASTAELVARIPSDNIWDDAGEYLLAVFYLAGRREEIGRVARERLQQAEGRPVATGRFREFAEQLEAFEEEGRARA